MKQIVLLLSFIVLATPLFSQQNNVFDGPAENGAYGALVMKLTGVKNEAAFMMGAYGGWLINHHFMLGLGGNVSVTHIRARDAAQEAYATAPYPLYIDFDYGGLLLEYTIAPASMVHVSVQALIGAGHVGYYYKGFTRPTHSGESVYTPGVGQLVFVAEPAVNVELNMMDWFRIYAGAGLRHVGGLSSDAIGVSDKDFRDVSFNLGLKFGWF